MAASLAKLSGSGIPNNSYTVVVPPEKIDELLEHNKGVVERAGCPEGSGSSDFGYGVWKIDKSNPKQFDDGRINATDGMVSVSLCTSQRCSTLNHIAYTISISLSPNMLIECLGRRGSKPISAFVEQ